MSRRVELLALGLALISASPLAAAGGDIELGKRLYETGRLASGEHVRGITQGDIPFGGGQFSCASCHRRSGYGSSEGGNFVPPVTGPFLFQARELDRAFLFKKLFKESQPRRFWARMRQPHMRPAYTERSLARALRTGIDPAGHALGKLMPRYEIPDADLANLSAYLRQLSDGPDPGVDDKTIRFATILSEDADPARREAMLETLRGFVAWMNVDTRGDLRHPNFSPHYRTDLIDAYRVWALDVWVLRGSPETWPGQLATYYRERPVFAVISGLVQGPWRPIGRFCEAEALPCLFPNTELPSLSDQDRYSVFFSRGLSLEARVIGRYLGAEEGLDPGRVVQVHADSEAGKVPAKALLAALPGAASSAPADGEFSDTVGMRAALAGNAAPERVLVLWPGAESRAALEWLTAHPAAYARVFLPSACLEVIPEDLPESLRERLYFAFPYELPSGYHPRAFRVRAWMRTRGLEIPFPRLQFNTYYALTLVQYGLEHIVDDFSRDYLLEYVEHEAENALNPGTFPHLSLGPGQRFASKGAFIVRLTGSPKPRERLAAVTPWVVP